MSDFSDLSPQCALKFSSSSKNFIFWTLNWTKWKEYVIDFLHDLNHLLHFFSHPKYNFVFAALGNHASPPPSACVNKMSDFDWPSPLPPLSAHVRIWLTHPSPQSGWRHKWTAPYSAASDKDSLILTKRHIRAHCGWGYRSVGQYPKFRCICMASLKVLYGIPARIV